MRGFRPQWSRIWIRFFFNGRLEVNTSNSLTLQSTFRPPIVQWRYASCQDSCLLGLKTLNDPRKNTQEQSKKNNKSRHFVDFQASSSFFKLTFYIIPETGWAFFNKKYNLGDLRRIENDWKTRNSTYFWPKTITIFFKFFQYLILDHRGWSFIWGIIELSISSSLEVSHFGMKNTLGDSINVNWAKTPIANGPG